MVTGTDNMVIEDYIRKSTKLLNSLVAPTPAMKGPREFLQGDVVGWSDSENRRFTMNSAYMIQVGSSSAVDEPIWRKIHKFCGIQRTRIFMCCTHSIAGWLLLIKGDKLDAFLSMKLSEWIGMIITNRSSFAKDPHDWDLLFGVVVWNLWLFQNVMAFGIEDKNSGAILKHSKHPLSLMQRAMVIGNINISIATRIVAKSTSLFTT
ncbi:hypothetical protein V6N13_043021 [Hibiscus sabdariffa]